MALNHAQSSLELLYNISRQLVSSLDLQTVLENVVNLSIQNLNAERGVLIVLDSQQRPAETVQVINSQRVANTMEQMKQVVDQGLAGWVLRSRQAALIPDTSQDERWVRRPDDEANRTGAKSAICVLLQYRGLLLGVLTLVHSEPGFFTQAHLDLLQSIGDQAGIAINNARLFDSLQLATQRYRELFENNIDPILISDWRGKILEGNRQAARLSGTGLPGLVGRSILEMHEANLDRMGEGLINLTSGEIISYESIFRPPQHESIPVEISVYRVRLQDEEVLQWTVRDISARKELDILRNDLAAMVYHDLRSPLSNIVSSLDMLEGLIPKEEVTSLRTIFGIATRSTERMQRLISSLLDINRLEAGQAITNQKQVSVTTLINDASDAVKPTVEGKQQHLEMEVTADLPSLWIDEDMIRRVLINLVENATKFTPMKGDIRILVDRTGSHVRFCVQDSGMGIPPEALDLVFEKFRRLNAENSPKGMGLGLAFCRLAVQAHGGRIWVESEVGKGSRFFFTLPASPQSSIN
jgi:two-component system, NtrC family, sensor histidine kinase KinB